MKKAAAFLIALTLLFSLCACVAPTEYTEMELGGTGTFYDVEYKIPSYYIFDSTESKENFVVYESGWYSKILLMSRGGVTKDPARLHLESYAEGVKEFGAHYCEFIEFNGVEAVLAKYNVEDKPCTEVYFVYGNSTYAIALRGETEENVDIFMSAVKLLPLS